MRFRVTLALVGLAAASLGIAHADEADAGVWEDVHVSWFAGWDTGHQTGSLALFRRPGLAGMPSELYGEASYEHCEGDDCALRSFDNQLVLNGGMDLDPIGNAASIDVCLDEINGGECEDLVFSLTRPVVLALAPCCMPSPWYDPEEGQAGLNARTGLWLLRGGYDVTGSVNGRALSSDAAGVFSSTQRFIGLEASAIVPGE